MTVSAAREAPWITVNGRGITAQQINAEVQYHPAQSLAKAREMAMQALVVRELLLQEAHSKGFLKNRRCATEGEQAAIDALLKSAVKVPDPDQESCARYYKNNRRRFVTSPLFEASHILFSAQEREKAEEAASLLQKSPQRFAALAKEHSSCSSAKDGGRLGQISKGQTTPEFEEALFKMQKGEISKSPVATRYGYHIILVHEHAASEELPFDAVRQWIADYLRQSVWQRGLSQYIGLLAGKADIKGFKMKSPATPLVQ